MVTSRRTASKPRTPRGTLSRDKILDAAVEVLGRDGLDGVTMRSVANALDVNAMSLYRHFRSKGELLLAVLDRLLARIELPPQDMRPAEALRSVMRAHYELLVRYPGLHLVAPTDIPTPAQLRTSERVFAILLAAGLDARESVDLTAALERFMLGCALRREDPQSPRSDEDHTSAEEFSSAFSRVPLGDYPTVRRVIAELDSSPRPREDIFEAGLSILLTPLETVASRQPEALREGSSAEKKHRHGKKT
ncbi:TetR/AcrR family transcriptional regulator [Streptomyces sp. NPDC004726]